MQRYYFYQKKEQFIDDFLNSVITKLFFIIHNSKDYCCKDTAFLKNFASLLPFWKYLHSWFSSPYTCLSCRWWRWRLKFMFVWWLLLELLFGFGYELCCLFLVFQSVVGGIVFFVNQWIRFVKNMKCLHRYHKIVKEIYKSQVYYEKNKTFINFALKKRR